MLFEKRQPEHDDNTPSRWQRVRRGIFRYVIDHLLEEDDGEYAYPQDAHEANALSSEVKEVLNQPDIPVSSESNIVQSASAGVETKPVYPSSDSGYLSHKDWEDLAALYKGSVGARELSAGHLPAQDSTKSPHTR